MSKLLVVNANVKRHHSRTERVKNALVELLCERDPSLEVQEVVLEDEQLVPLNSQLLRQRDRAVEAGDMDDPVFAYAKQFAAADVVVIAAPYWALEFPAALKCYLERVDVVDIVYRYTETAETVGLCCAEVLYYVTTCGGYLGEHGERNYGFNLIDDYAGQCGIGKRVCIAAEGLDVWGVDVEGIVAQTIASLSEKLV